MAMNSDRVMEGLQQAPHRSLFNALGFTEEERKKPLIGIVSSFNEIVPGHMNLDKITEAVKLAVAEAGGMPVVVPAIAVCDGIAMGHIGMKYSLVTRDLIADSTECLAKAHAFDGILRNGESQGTVGQDRQNARLCGVRGNFNSLKAVGNKHHVVNADFSETMEYTADFNSFVFKIGPVDGRHSGLGLSHREGAQQAQGQYEGKQFFHGIYLFPREYFPIFLASYTDDREKYK